MALVPWKFADRHSKDTVFGYIKRIEKTFKKLNIPLGIQQICLEYYFWHEFFKTHDEHIEVNNNGTIAKGVTDNPMRSKMYGNQIIDLSDESMLKYIWIFYVAVNDVKDAEDFCVGLRNVKTGKPYGWTQSWRIWPGYCDWSDRGDKLTLILSTKKIVSRNKQTHRRENIRAHTLSLRVNERWPPETLEINDHGSYNLAIRMSCKNQQIELEHFTTVFDTHYGFAKSNSAVTYLKSVYKYVKTLM
eukprot:110069_1